MKIVKENFNNNTCYNGYPETEEEKKVLKKIGCGSYEADSKDKIIKAYEYDKNSISTNM